jgi:NAD(P)-dependent dehydrogenase (short-subunit alcohol dehydrogenase family)
MLSCVPYSLAQVSPSKIDRSLYSKAVLFNNAASLEPLTYIQVSLNMQRLHEAAPFNRAGCQQEIRDLSLLRASIDLNVTSCIYLAARFTEMFGAPRADGPVHGEASTQPAALDSAAVVNVSSLAAIEAFPSMGVYCAGG